ncbi:DUF362 domain-containing protein [Desulfallas thermosapovorans]|uniref:4Fe-4S ferredoxin-type domain-containing protein n=1 Tax=Desulfallas thermosapovorans DSM 6562 TaxID=1121431 RepID=A0A5S4ZSA8_9FIRM|nr:DUF362 domain-containing protein [Desulfallas thermosapovorans]TYO95542.1 hypothetical protein LX24_01504 [Desulfallas thermosapovorans DSM 6562]
MSGSSEVYFTDLRTSSKENLFNKLAKLCSRVGLKEIIQPKELVALKVHFGERGNLAYIRPQFVRQIVDKVREYGGKPFLTDANTLYVGSRANAVDHLETAIQNGFDYAVVNAPLIIADGLNGKDYVNVPIAGKHFKEVKIGSAAYHAGAIISITHFKGHELTGFGGTLKNLGMGLGCRSGKQMMHSDVLPRITAEKCLACGLCARWCPATAINIEEHAAIDENVCWGCGECTVTCPHGAIKISWKTQPNNVQEKIVEYTMGVLKNKEHKAVHFTFIMNVSPECDCCTYNDAPVVRDIGIAASRDPVALDQACIDLVNSEVALSGSRLGDNIHTGDKFGSLHKGIDWSVQLAYGEEMGLGTRKYRLIKV